MLRTIIATAIVTAILVAVGTSMFWMKTFRGAIQKMVDQRVTQFEILSDKSVDVVFLGDSITQGGLWHELFPGIGVINRGVNGNTTGDVLARIDQVFRVQPKKMFLMIGVNDLNKRLGPDVAIENYTKLFELIDNRLPNTKIYIQSVLPVNDTWKLTDNTDIPKLNAALKSEADKRGYIYIDLHPFFSDSSGKLKTELSNDGIHLHGIGYSLWRSQIIHYLQ